MTNKTSEKTTIYKIQQDPAFKFFMDVRKAYQDKGEWYLQGVASGLLEDGDDERVSINVLKKFVEAIPLPLIDAHDPSGSILAEIGEVVMAEILDDDDSSLFIKARLDKENPAVQYMVKKIQDGKKFAFSISGDEPIAKTVWSEKLNKFIDEIIEVVPTNISVTTRPSYKPSFAEVLAKALKKGQNVTKGINTNNELSLPQDLDDESKKKLSKLKNSTKMADEKDKTQSEDENLDKSNSDSDSENQGTVDKTADKETESKDKVEKSESKGKTELKKSYSNKKEDKDMDKEKDSEKEDLEKEADADESEDESDMEKMEEEDGEETSEVSMADLVEVIGVLAGKIDELIGMKADMAKSEKKNRQILKSLHEDLETMSKMPLQKKSRVMAKSLEERSEAKPSFKSVAESYLNG